MRLVAQPIGFLEELLLLGGILLHVGLQAEQQVLIDERLGVIRFDLQRVIDGFDAFADEVALLGFLQLEVAVRLVPVIRGDRVERLGVVRLFLRALLERLDRLVKAALAVVVAGERHVDRRIARFGLLRHLEHLLGLLERAGILVNLGEREVVGRLAGLELNHLLHDGLRFRRIVQLVGAVRRDEILERQRAELLVRRVGRGRELLGGFLVVVHSLGEQRVVSGLALLARLVQVIVAVPEVEIGLCQPRVGGDGLLVEPGRLLVILRLVGLVGGLERFSCLDLANFRAAD